MKLAITYGTKERISITKNTYQNIEKDAELPPVAIYRFACGTGAAANRYYYEADFIAPDDAEFSINGLIRVNIIRKKNPKFNPKDYSWEGQKALINEAGK